MSEGCCCVAGHPAGSLTWCTNKASGCQVYPGLWCCRHSTARGSQRFYCGLPLPYSLQAVEAAQLAEDLKVQLEHTQSKLKEIQVSVAENRTARERESSNLKRAQVCCIVGGWGGCLRRSIRWAVCFKLPLFWFLPGGPVQAEEETGKTEKGGDVHGRWWDPAGGDQPVQGQRKRRELHCVYSHHLVAKKLQIFHETSGRVHIRLLSARL